jgi:hypothetical protein
MEPSRPSKRVHLVLLYVTCAAGCWAAGYLAGVRNGTVASLVVGYGGGAVLTAIVTGVLWKRGWELPSLRVLVFSQIKWMVFGPMLLILEPAFGRLGRNRREADPGTGVVADRAPPVAGKRTNSAAIAIAIVALALEFAISEPSVAGVVGIGLSLSGGFLAFENPRGAQARTTARWMNLLALVTGIGIALSPLWA